MSLKGFIKNVGNGIGNAVNNVGNAVGDAAASTAKTAADLAKKAKEAAEKLEKERKEAEAKAKAAIEKAAADVKANTKKLEDKIKESIKKAGLIGQDLAFAPLLPLKATMSAALDRAKITHTSSLKDISVKFCSMIVEKNSPLSFQHNYLNGGSMFIKPETGNFYAEEAEYTEKGSEAAKYEVGAKNTMNIIQKIIQWFKDRKAKKAAGQKLSAEELLTLADADKASEDAIAQAQYLVDQEAGFMGTGFSITKILISVAVASVLLYLAFGGKKKKTA